VEVCFVTTLDNPYNYFDDFDNWYDFDTSHGYNTCQYVAGVTKTSGELSDRDRALAINQAVDDIVRINVTGNYVKVRKTIPDDV